MIMITYDYTRSLAIQLAIEQGITFYTILFYTTQYRYQIQGVFAFNLEKQEGNRDMPLYEYQCEKCKKTYEALVSMSKADDPGECPHCGFEKSKRLLSTFSPSM